MKEPAVRGRVAWSEWGRDEERGLKEPAVRERVARSVRWRDEERGVERA